MVLRLVAPCYKKNANAAIKWFQLSEMMAYLASWASMQRANGSITAAPSGCGQQGHQAEGQISSWLAAKRAFRYVERISLVPLGNWAFGNFVCSFLALWPFIGRSWIDHPGALGLRFPRNGSKASFSIWWRRFGGSVGSCDSLRFFKWRRKLGVSHQFASSAIFIIKEADLALSFSGRGASRLFFLHRAGRKTSMP